MKGWAAWFRRDTDSLAWEIDEELDEHIAQRVEDNLARGMTPRDAQAEARRRLGPRRQAVDASRRYRGRAESVHRAMAFDLRDAWRAARRSRGTSITGLIVVTVGLGTLFGAARLGDALLGRAPGGVRSPSTLISVSESFDGEHPQLFTRAAFEALANGVPDGRPFAWSDRGAQVVHDRGSLEATVAFVSGDYFASLGVAPEAGRMLSSGDQAAAAPLAVINARLAASVADSPAAAVGAELTIVGQPFVVVGVVDSRFGGVESGHPVDIWLPVATEPMLSTPTVLPDGSVYQGFWSTPGIGWLRVALRQPTGMSIEALTARLTTALREGDPGPRNDTRTPIVETRPWISPFSGDRERIEAVMAPIAWAMLCTLLLTAACLGSLYVGRASDRRHEHSMRVALGAARMRLFRLVSLEIAIVIGVGTVAALLASELLLGTVERLQLTTGVTVGDALTPLDGRSLATLGLLALGLSVLAVAMPVLFVRRAARGSVGPSSRTTSGQRVRRGLMAAQVAAGTALLAAAALLTASIDGLANRPLGFDPARVAYLYLDPAGAGLEPGEIEQVTRRSLASPLGPQALVAIADALPFQRGRTRFLYAPDADLTQQVAMPTTHVGGPYFEAMGVDVVGGRTFTPADRDRPVAILSDTLAEGLWPNEPAVGRTVLVGGTGGVPHEVVGVVASLRDASLRGGRNQRLYLPFNDSAEALALIARPPAGSAAALVEPLRRMAAAFDRRLVVLDAGTVDMLATRTIEQRVLFRMLTAMLGVGSLVMVAAGVWGLSHGTLRQRWREFGIRQALGAGRHDVARLALSDALFVSAAGGTLGLLAGWQFGRLLESWLFGVEPWDPVSLAMAAALVAAAAVGGAIQPAVRASRIGPATLLRQA